MSNGVSPSPDWGLRRSRLGGPEATVGLGFELFHRLLRVDLGWAVQARAFGAAVDVSRDFWDIL